VLPQNGGSVPVIGGRPEASNSATAQLDLTYFATPYIALNLIAATTRHDVSVQNSAIGNVGLGHVWALPPTLTLQVHPLPRERFSPYLGLGVNYTVFYGEGGTRDPAVTDMDVRNAWGMAVNFGLDVELAPRWLLNLDAKKIFFLEPDVKVDTLIGRLNARADISPWVVGANVRYRF
jgi:outer membrane protein